LWNVYTKVTSGPKLKLRAFGGAAMEGHVKGEPLFVKVVLQNRGTAPTTVTDFRFYGYRSLWGRLRQKDPQLEYTPEYQGRAYPQPLEVGSEWIAFVKQDEFLHKLVGTGDLWVEVAHSFSKRRAQSRIRPPQK
jgi:hypothetical protein